jgi:hypothetical protein
MALQPLCTLPVFQLLNPYTIGRTPWTGDQPVARPLPTHRTTRKQNKRTQTSMSGRTPWKGDQPVARPLPTHRTMWKQNKRTQTSMSLVGFEPTIPVFEWAKMVHSLDHAATVIGSAPHSLYKMSLTYVISWVSNLMDGKSPVFDEISCYGDFCSHRMLEIESGNFLM